MGENWTWQRFQANDYMSATSKVSFTVRRPTPLSRPSSTGPESDGQFKVPALPRHLAGARSATGSPLASSREGSDDEGIVFSKNGTSRGSGGREYEESSDDDGTSVEEELVTEFDQFSVQRASNKKSKAPEPASLVIPSLPNPDWRETARKRRTACQAKHHTLSTHLYGSVGGLGTKDTINSGPQLVGLQVNKKVKVGLSQDVVGQTETMTTTVVESTHEESMEVEETEDQRAIRALLAGEDGSSVDIDAIPTPALTETDALRQDVNALPECATEEDYARVPVSAFGLAMLRGMGWTEGTVASKSDKGKKHGLVEPYLPQARPALLGIGAKEQETLNDGSGKRDGREESGSSRSGTASRRASRSPPGRTGDFGHDMDYGNASDRDRRRVYDDREKDRREDDRRERDETMTRDGRKDYREDSDRDRHGRRG
ncbi:DExH-box splicing factor binding site-domain-containing protein [Pisolithus sp. B1]|nr:DExH-box splicing factor binding site-domain-containing protein [Pisolithus sp. B1]